MATIEIAGRPVGPGHAPLVLPDIGTFFNRDTDAAKAMVAQLKAGGAEMVKGEILHDPDVCLDDDTEESYYAPARGEMVKERYRALIERKVLPLSAYEEIFAGCTRAGLPFVVSVYDFRGADFAREIGAAALKIATSNIVHEPLIRHVAALGLPVIIDTGRSTMSEIARALQWARSAGASALIVEHSPPPPPAPVDQQNLRVLEVFAAAFACPVGLSDHHAGPEMLYAAAALGASLLEKGICRDDNPDDQDVGHALPAGRFREVNETCQTIFRGLGDGQLPLAPPRKLARMGLAAGRDLDAGDVLSLETARFAFPAKGIPVEHWSLVEGWRLRRPVAKGLPITWADVEPLAS